MEEVYIKQHHPQGGVLFSHQEFALHKKEAQFFRDLYLNPSHTNPRPHPTLTLSLASLRGEYSGAW